MAKAKPVVEANDPEWRAFVSQFGQCLPWPFRGLVYHDEGVSGPLWDEFIAARGRAQEFYQRMGKPAAGTPAFAEYVRMIEAAAEEYSIPVAVFSKPKRKAGQQFASWARDGAPGSPDFHLQLIDLYGKRNIEQAGVWCREGFTAEQLRRRMRISPSAARRLMAHFQALFPEAFQCAGCTRTRRPGMKMERQPDGRMLCWICVGKENGRYDLRNQKLDQAARRYSEGEKLEEVLKDLKLHWTDGHLVLTTRTVRRRCASCDRLRRAGVAFVPGIFTDGNGRQERRAVCKRCADEQEGVFPLEAPAPVMVSV